MILQSPPQQLDVTRADFLDKEFRKFVAQKGLYIEWEQNLVCPCHISSGDVGLDLSQVIDVNENISFNPSCVVCSGKGVIRHSKQEIQAIVTQAEGKFDTRQYGTERTASAKFSLLPEHLPSFGDRFRLKNSAIIQNEIITRGAGFQDSTTHPIFTRNLTLAAGITPISILAIYITNADGTTNPVQPIQDTDFTLVADANGKLMIDWQIGVNAAGNFPQADQQYSVAYYSNPIYTITSEPHTLRDTNIRVNGNEVPTSLIIQVEARLEML